MSDPPATIGPYEVLAELGRGGMGVVYRARRGDLDREFALKVIRSDLPGGSEGAPQLLARFRREAQAAARLAGTQGIVAVHDIGEYDGSLYLAMDLVDGHGFDEEVAAGDVLPEHAARVVEQAARALHAAHVAGIIHRDVKPANILVDRGGTAWVTDLGLATAVALDDEATRLTKSGTLLGTVAYMPPEQAAGDDPTPAADVWALGATLYDAISGTPPFGGGSSLEVLSKLFRDEPEPLRRLVPEVPPELDAVVMHCLARDPSERYGSAKLLAEDLAAWLRGDAPSVKPAGTLGDVGRQARRHRRPLLVGAGVCVAGAALAWAGWAGWAANRSAAAKRDAETAAREAEDARRLRAGAFQSIEAATREPFTVLENAFLQAVVTPAETVAARAAVATELDRYEPVDAAVWRVYADVLAGEATLEMLATLEDDSARDPIPSLLLARARILWFLGRATLPVPRPGQRVPWLDENIDTVEWQAERDTAAEALDRASRSPAWPLLPHGSEAQQIRSALQSAARGESGEARAALASAVDDPAWGDLARALTGYFLAAEARFEEAAEVLEALARRRRWPLLLQVAGQVWFNVVVEQRAAQQDAMPALERSLAALDQACAWQPALTRAAMQRGVVRTVLAIEQRNRGQDPRAGLVAAIDQLDAAAKTVESPPHLDIARGGLWLEFGRALARRGESAEKALKHSIAAATRAVEAFPQSVTEDQLLLERGMAWEALAREREEVPEGPSDCRAKAIADFQRVIVGMPNDPLPHNELANTYLRQGQWLARRGRDPEHSYTEAEGALRQAQECDPKWPAPISNLANLSALRASWAQSSGGDPTAHLEEAIRRYTAALDLAPDHTNLFHSRANVLRQRAARRWRTGGDPVPELQRALDDLNRALKRQPGHSDALIGRGHLQLQWARILARDPVAAEPHIDAALEDFKAGRRLNPSAPGTAESLANAFTTKADITADLQGDPLPYENLAIELFSRLIKVVPDRPVPYFSRGAIYMKRAFRAAQAGRPSPAMWAPALADAEACIARNARYTPALFNRALCLHQLGRLAEAKAGYSAVLGLQPSHRGARAMLAQVERLLAAQGK